MFTKKFHFVIYGMYLLQKYGNKKSYSVCNTGNESLHTKSNNIGNRKYYASIILVIILG